MAKGIFVTGTDTGIGKTWFSLALIEALKQHGFKVAGMKPIASGAEETDGQLKNDDALKLQAACSNHHDYEIVNPYVFEPPIAPHIAADQINAMISTEQIQQNYNELAATNDFVVVEGVGGWRVPISSTVFLTDVVKQLNLPVLIVVGLRLGCINHAFLTAESVVSDGVSLCGWAGNQVEKSYAYVDQTILTLKQGLMSPCIANMNYSSILDIESTQHRIDLTTLLEQLENLDKS